MKDDIQINSLLFDFLKKKALLETGIGVQIDGFQFTPIQDAQNAVCSLLLIDLFGIFDKAIELVFVVNRLKDQKKKSKFQILRERNLIDDNLAKYLLWYRDWRNDAAHNSKLIEYHELQQATDDIQKQLFNWQLIDKVFQVRPYWEKVSKNGYRKGARLVNMPILIYEIEYFGSPPTSKHPSNSNSVRKIVDLSFEEYILTIKDENKYRLPDDLFYKF